MPTWRNQPELRNEIVAASARLEDGELRVVQDLLLLKLGPTCWHPRQAIRGLAREQHRISSSCHNCRASSSAHAAEHSSPFCERHLLAGAS